MLLQHFHSVVNGVEGVIVFNKRLGKFVSVAVGSKYVFVFVKPYRSQYSHTKGKRSKLPSPFIEKDSTHVTLSQPGPHLGSGTPIPSRDRPGIFTSWFYRLYRKLIQPTIY